MTGTTSPTAPGGGFPIAGRPVPRLGCGMGQVNKSAGPSTVAFAVVALLRQA